MDVEKVGTYFLKANQKGGGAYVANCGYVTANSVTGMRTCAHECATIRWNRGSTRVSSDAVQLRGGDKRERGAAVAKPRLRDCGAVAGCIFASEAETRGCVGEVSRAVRGLFAYSCVLYEYYRTASELTIRHNVPSGSGCISVILRHCGQTEDKRGVGATNVQNWCPRLLIETRIRV